MRFCFYIDELVDEEMARVACQPTTTTSIIDIGFFPFEVKCFSKGMQKCSKYYILLFFSKSRPSSSTSFLHQHLIGLARLSLPLFWLLIQSPLVGGSRHYSVVNSSSPTIFPPLSLSRLQFGTKHYLHSSHHWHTQLFNQIHIVISL